MNDKIFTTRQAAKYLDVPMGTLQSRVRAGHITPLPQAGNNRFTQASLDSYTRGRPGKPPKIERLLMEHIQGLKTGEPLEIVALRAEYEVKYDTLYKAMRRLAARGIVKHNGKRGWRSRWVVCTKIRYKAP